MPVSATSSSSPDVVQLLMLKKQMSVEASRTGQLLEGLRTPPAAAPPARPTAPGAVYL